jgi:hypothetical protein
MPPTAPRRPARRSSGGGFWLGIAIIVGGIAAVYVFAPDLPRRLLASKDAPPVGEEPALAQSSHTDLEIRETNAVDSQLTKPSEVVRTAAAAKPVTDKPEVAAAPIKNAFADEAKAQALLAEAEAAYAEAPAAKNWSKAISKARAITSLAAKPATLVRAQDIVKGSQAMEKLFKELDDRDELSRNFETHPSLVLLIDGPNPSQAVPIRSMDDQTVVDGDPVAWLQAQRRTGSITVLLRGKKDFLPAKIPADHVGKIEKADIAATIAEKRTEFDERLSRLKNSDLANNALAWYDAAKFAYQNRIDDRVAGMMDKALVLDPRLASSVREDKAAGLFATLVLHLNNGNVKQAAPFMAIIDKRFDDTPSGIEARAFYDLKTKQSADDVAAAQAALRQAREDARLRAKEEADRRRTERVERAKQLGDEDAVKAAEREHDDVGTTEMGAPPTGNEAKADDLFAQGKEAYQKALDAGNTGNRDQLYHEAQKYLTEAQNIYNALLEKSPNTALEDKAFMCNKLRYGSIKQQRFH